MNMRKEFEDFFDKYFCDCQGEDSPYSYEDIRTAFKEGWIRKTRGDLR